VSVRTLRANNLRVFYAAIVPTEAQIKLGLWNLIVIFLSILIGYELRNHVVVGCLVGLAVCFMLLSIAGLWARYKTRGPSASPVEVAEGHAFTPPPGSSGGSFLLHVVSASVGPIVENFQALTGYTVHEEARTNDRISGPPSYTVREEARTDDKISGD
jgi:hypothetical protein